MSRVFQSHLPVVPWQSTASWRLPGVQPQDTATWLFTDDAFAGQMAERDRLLRDRPVQVHRMRPDARDAASECLSLVLDHLTRATGYTTRSTTVTRPDGVTIGIDRANPLFTIGRLVQEDICILQDSAEGHRLTGAVLCFPASWTLAEKIGHPLIRIHAPVNTYDTDQARRVQRIFDGLRHDRPVWRANALLYERPDLFAPRREGDGPRHTHETGQYLRSERQVLRRLPETRALVFAIHTTVIPVDKLSGQDRAGLELVRERAADD